MIERLKTLLNDVPAYSEFNYWFQFTPAALQVIDKATSAKLYHVSYDKIATFYDDMIHEEDTRCAIVAEEFLMFQKRPEYNSCIPISVPCPSSQDFDLEYLAESYCWLLIGAALVRYQRGLFHRSATDPSYRDKLNSGALEDMMWKMFNNCCKWLMSTDFFRAPASRQYHDSFTGGLCYHTLTVFNRGIDLFRTNIFPDVTVDQIALVSLVHDWCKIGIYESYLRNVKNEETNQWEKVMSFRYAETWPFPCGHGVASYMLASKFFNLTLGETLAIRWHMGRWQVGDCEMGELQQSNAQYPLVYMLQFADQLACTNYANQN